MYRSMASQEVSLPPLVVAFAAVHNNGERPLFHHLWPSPKALSLTLNLLISHYRRRTGARKGVVCDHVSVGSVKYDEKSRRRHETLSKTV